MKFKLEVKTEKGRKTEAGEASPREILAKADDLITQELK